MHKMKRYMYITKMCFETQTSPTMANFNDGQGHKDTYFFFREKDLVTRNTHIYDV